MSWVRIHDGALTHPKIVGLSDSAFRLWVWGLSYCQQHLTDGWIPPAALPVKSKPDALVDARLWMYAAQGGFDVHGYLDWNDSRETVQKKRASLRARVTRYRGDDTTRTRNASATSGVGVTDLTKIKISEGESEGKPSPRQPQVVPSLPSDDVAARAAALLETYGELYAKHRKGAKHLQMASNLDWTQACDLCRTWDDERLRKLIDIFLTTDDEWVSSTARTFRLFVTRATWCDDRLAQWEAKRKQA